MLPQGTVRTTDGTGLIARVNHTATLLTDGRVLIAGGTDATGHAIADAQLWDASTGDSGAVATIASGHRGRIIKPDFSEPGKVFCGAAKNSAARSTATGELYNPQSRTFEGPILGDDARLVPSTQALQESPFVTDSIPTTDAAGVGIDGPLALRFSKPVRIEQLNQSTVSLIGPAGAVAGKVVGAENGILAFFMPNVELSPGTTYTLFVHDVADSGGQTVPLTSIRFATRRLPASNSAGAQGYSNLSPATPPRQHQPLRSLRPLQAPG